MRQVGIQRNGQEQVEAFGAAAAKACGAEAAAEGDRAAGYMKHSWSRSRGKPDKGL
jgi:hypothetical protein